MATLNELLKYIEEHTFDECQWHLSELTNTNQIRLDNEEICILGAAIGRKWVERFPEG